MNTYEKIQAQRNDALKAVLLFHSASPWTTAKRTEWGGICQNILGHSGYDSGWEATTKVLCDLVRKVLDNEN